MSELDLLAAEVQFEHEMRLLAPDCEVKHRPRSRARPKTALISQACGSEPQMRFAGLRCPRFTAKYADDRYVRVGRYQIRQLSSDECDEFRRHVTKARVPAVKAVSWNPWTA